MKLTTTLFCKRAAAAACMAALALGTHSAHALVVGLGHAVIAQTADAPRQVKAGLSGLDFFDETVTSKVVSRDGGASVSTASQDVVVADRSLSGSGSASIGLADGNTGKASSAFSTVLNFLNAVSYTGFAELASEGQGFAEAGFELVSIDAAGAAPEAFADLSNPLLTLSGTLGPGRYLLSMLASINSIDPNEGGSSRFGFRIDFTDVVAPPAGVPEPQTVALVMTGLLACAAVLRRKA